MLSLRDKDAMHDEPPHNGGHVFYQNQLKFPESASVYPAGQYDLYSLRQSGLPQSIVADFSTGLGKLLPQQSCSLDSRILGNISKTALDSFTNVN